MDIDMSRLKNGLKDTVLTQIAIFVFLTTISTPKSYDKHPRQVKYGSPPRASNLVGCCQYTLTVVIMALYK